MAPPGFFSGFLASSDPLALATVFFLSPFLSSAAPEVLTPGFAAAPVFLRLGFAAGFSFAGALVSSAGAGGGAGFGRVTYDHEDPPVGSVLVTTTLSPGLGPLLPRFGGIHFRYGLRGGRQGAEMALDQGQDLFRLEITDYGYRGVVGPIISVIELP